MKRMTRLLSVKARHKLVAQLEREGRPEALTLGQRHPLEREVLIESVQVGPAESLFVPSNDPNIFERYRCWDPYRVHRLKNVTLDTHSGYVFHDQHVIAQSQGSIRSASDGAFVSNAWIRVKKIASVEVTDQPIIGTGYLNNYFHWLVEVLPRVLWAREVEPEVVAVIPPNSPRFVFDSLEALDVPIRSTSCELFSAPVVVVADATAHSFPYPGSIELLLRETRKSLRTDSSGPEVIFVKRKGTGRQFANDRDLESWLAEVGVYSVDPAELSWVDQVALFQSAKLIIGAHGAGLANSVFAAPNAPLVEITSGSWWTVSYATLSAMQGRAHYLCLLNQDAEAPYGRSSNVIQSLEGLLPDMIAGQDP